MITQAKIKHITESQSNVIYPIYEDDSVCSKVIERLGYDIAPMVDRKVGSITKIATLGKFEFPFFTFVGLGKEHEITTAILRDALSVAMKQADSDVVLDAKRAVCDALVMEDVVYIAVESYILSRYQFTKIGAEKKEEKNLEIVAGEDVNAVITKAINYCEPVNHARDLSNMPSNLMTPEVIADYATALAKQYDLEYTILGNKELKEIKAGALLGVNQGSKHEARLIVLKYQGDGDAPFTALIGKGLTFDSGGYNLKPSASMKGMKYDMCGGANVLGALEIIVRQKMKANVMAIVPSTENMISGEAFKCDDVLTSLSGKTIEITNTDAEGRLILCDAITYATQLGAKRIIDIATLTGACVVALGPDITGVFSNDDQMLASFQRAASLQDEKNWRLPTDSGFTKLLKESKVADLVNSVAGSAGASLAACFLQEFVEEGISWIHVDIAGTSDTKSDTPKRAGGATGAMTRSMAQLFELN